jgi:hypothetical protein
MAQGDGDKKVTMLSSLTHNTLKTAAQSVAVFFVIDFSPPVGGSK